MHVHFKPTFPDDIEMTMTLTMTLKEWKKIEEQLPTEYPSWDLSREIRDLVSQADKHFYPKDEDDG